MWTLILRDLQHRRTRVLVVAVLMAVVLTLLFIMNGLVVQFRFEPVSATERAAGGSGWVVSQSSTGPLTSPTPIAVESIAGVDGEPILVTIGSLNGSRATVIGRSSFDAQPRLVEGRRPEGGGELVVDDSAGYAVGERVELGETTATVVGLTDDATSLAGVPMAFTTLDFAQKSLTDGRRVVTGALVDERPADVPPGLKYLTPDEVAADGLVPLENAISSVSLVRALLWLIALIIIAAVIYITALERTRDVAVLKAVGAANRALGLSLIGQGVIMAVLATLLAAVLQVVVAPAFPMTVRVTQAVFWQILIGSVAVALVAGIAGARRVFSTEPAEAFG
jgi:putative ABC transport system permease protein